MVENSRKGLVEQPYQATLPCLGQILTLPWGRAQVVRRVGLVEVMVTWWMRVRAGPGGAVGGEGGEGGGLAGAGAVAAQGGHLAVSVVLEARIYF